MVLAERNTTELARNGRRSRGPSPNTHAGGGGTVNVNSTGGGASSGASSVGGNSTNVTANEKASNVTTTVPGAGTPESSDDDNSTKRNGKSKAKQSEYEEKIRVGRDYQAVCPPLIPEVERRPELMNERALLVWSPTKEIPDMKLEEYISVAKEKYGYNGEQALGMLFWHKHDLERAVMDLANFTPFPDEWTMEDKVLFEQAFQFHGKSFHRIRQMLPDKSIASLVKYYYSWKKTRHRSSAMDRQEKPIKTAVKDGSENGSEVGSNEESDNDDKIQKNKQIMEQLEKDCEAINIEDAANAGKPGASPEIAQPRISARWTQDEIQMAILALRDYGKNYAMIAKVVLTKTEAHVRNFYLHNRRRLNLDQIVKEHEALMACKVDQVGGNGCGEEPADGSDVVLVDGTPAIKTSADESNNRSSQEQKKDEFLSKKTKEVTAAIKDTENDTVVSAVAVGSPTTIPTSSSATDANIAANSSPVIGKSSKLVVLTPSTTFTIVDESDTTTNSSSDAAISNSINNAPGTLSSLSSSSVSVAGKSSPSNRSSERDSEESFPIKSGVGGAKRDSSVLQNTEKSAAKKIAISSEFYEK
ncbi:REST corepressor isoform X3 [Scaptodrosophila lebanonensis]|uniref:REST corepressor isoform X3 n=1 Tax=Drosophila lebanonensis TaxID=7225 RepID=A0A6J2U2E9_DROLE|nr:REST corepressor isoform X3 [Scaptodrosophila lebanonensis]